MMNWRMDHFTIHSAMNVKWKTEMMKISQMMVGMGKVLSTDMTNPTWCIEGGRNCTTTKDLKN
jgi:hypothetical protein